MERVSYDGSILTESTTHETHEERASAGRTSKSWLRQRHLLSLNGRLLIPLLSSATFGFDASMMNGLLSLGQWNDYFHTPRSSLLGLINAVMPLGLLVAALPAGWIADRYGRRRSIIVGIFVLIVAATMQTASHNIATFIVARFLIGIGVEFAETPSPVLISELAYPTHRGKVTSLYNCFYYVGSIASSWITFGSFNLESSWSWRIPSLLQMTFAVIQAFGIWFVPESPRWLIKNGREDEAREILIKYHGGGDDKSLLVASEMEAIASRLSVELSVASTGWSGLWQTKADRRRLFIICFIPFMTQWAGNGIITYYLALVLDTVGITDSFHQTLINGVLQIFNGCAAVFGAMLVDRMGRRKLWLWSSCGMLVSYVIWTACAAVNYETSDQALGYIVVVFVFIYFFHYDIAFTALTFSYATEILPFHARAKGLSIVNFGAGLTIMFNTFINPIALDDIAWRYYIVYCVLLFIISVVIYKFFPETRGLTLEQIADVFESDAPAYRMQAVAIQNLQNPQRDTNKDSPVATESMRI